MYLWLDISSKVTEGAAKLTMSSKDPADLSFLKFYKISTSTTLPRDFIFHCFLTVSYE